MNVFDGGNQARLAKGVRPIFKALLGKQPVTPGAGELVKGCGRLGEQHVDHSIVRIFGQLHRRKARAHAAQLGDGSFIIAAIVQAAGALVGAALAIFFFLGFLLRRNIFLLFGFRLGLGRLLELGF